MLLIFLLILTVIGRVIEGQDLDWYKSELSNNVAPPYILAYSALQTGIINPLLAATNTSSSNQLANILNCGAVELNNNLSYALANSDTIRKKIDESIIQLIEAISDRENKIRQGSIDLVSLRAQIESIQKQVKTAEDGVKEKEAGVAAADAAVRDAEKAMDDAMNCRIKRRRRFLGDTLPFLKPFCTIFNQNIVKDAFKRQTDADGQYESAKTQLDTYKDNLNDVKSQETDLNTQVSEASTQIATYNSTLSQFRQEQLVITDISEKLKKIILHLTTIFDSSSILKDVITKLLDFELLITPLNMIYKNMLDNGIIAGAAEATTISSETIKKIRTNIDQIVIKLPDMPFNVNGTSTC